jgi:hypothetical protein
VHEQQLTVQMNLMYLKKLDSEGNVFTFIKAAKLVGGFQLLKTRYNGT